MPNDEARDTSPVRTNEIEAVFNLLAAWESTRGQNTVRGTISTQSFWLEGRGRGGPLVMRRSHTRSEFTEDLARGMIHEVIEHRQGQSRVKAERLHINDQSYGRKAARRTQPWQVANDSRGLSDFWEIISGLRFEDPENVKVVLERMTLYRGHLFEDKRFEGTDGIKTNFYNRQCHFWVDMTGTLVEFTVEDSDQVDGVLQRKNTVHTRFTEFDRPLTVKAPTPNEIDPSGTFDLAALAAQDLGAER